MWGLAGAGGIRAAPGLRIPAYDPELANRFQGWPRDVRPNLRCVLAEFLVPGVGWDSAGRGIAMISDRHFVGGHNGAVKEVWIDVPGAGIQRHSARAKPARRVSSAASSKGNFALVIGELDAPVTTPGFAPLAILVTPTSAAVRGLPIAVFGAAGKVGFESLHDLRGVGTGTDDLVAVADVRDGDVPGAARVVSGDSGGAVVAKLGERGGYPRLAVVGPILGYTPGAGAPTFNLYGFLGGYRNALDEIGRFRYERR